MEPILLPGLWSLAPLPALIGMVVLFYYLLATGRIITKSSHEREVGIYKEQIVNKDQTISRQGDQIDALMSVGTTVKALIRSAAPPLDEDTEGGR